VRPPRRTGPECASLSLETVQASIEPICDVLRARLVVEGSMRIVCDHFGLGAREDGGIRGLQLQDALHQSGPDGLVGNRMCLLSSRRTIVRGMQAGHTTCQDGVYYGTPG